MIAEVMLGRRGHRNPIETMELLTEEAGADKNWHYLGWMGVIAGLLILSKTKCQLLLKGGLRGYSLNCPGPQSILVLPGDMSNQLNSWVLRNAIKSPF